MDDMNKKEQASQTESTQNTQSQQEQSQSEHSNPSFAHWWHWLEERVRENWQSLRALIALGAGLYLIWMSIGMIATFILFLAGLCLVGYALTEANCGPCLQLKIYVRNWFNR